MGKDSKPMPSVGSFAPEKQALVGSTATVNLPATAMNHLSQALPGDFRHKPDSSIVFLNSSDPIQGSQRGSLFTPESPSSSR